MQVKFHKPDILEIIRHFCRLLRMYGVNAGVFPHSVHTPGGVDYECAP